MSRQACILALVAQAGIGLALSAISCSSVDVFKGHGTYILIRGDRNVSLGNVLPKDSPEFHPSERHVSVDIRTFRISKTLVTVARYCQFLNSDYAKNLPRDQLYQTDEDERYRIARVERVPDGSYKPRPGAQQQPVARATWLGAVRYCDWLTKLSGSHYRYRLPSEAEWEYVVRGVEGRVWPWGNTPPTPERGWFWGRHPWDENRPRWLLADVGSYPGGATREGVLDLMCFPMREWCINKYKPQPTPAEMTSTEADTVDLDSRRVARGGLSRRRRHLTIWHGLLSDMDHRTRVWTRFSADPMDGRWNTGFRVVREVVR